MLSFIISLSLLISQISSRPIASCSDQQNCINAESIFDLESDAIEICLSYDNTDPQCIKEDAISYACYNEIEEDKIEGFGDEEGETKTMCIVTDCKRDAAPEERFVEFGLKDGRGCGDSSSTADINGFTDECRAANEEMDDVLCGGGQKDHCIHKFFYDCPETTTTEAPSETETTPGGGVPTCETQIPCLSIDIRYDWCDDEGSDNLGAECSQVIVDISYDDSDPACIKDPDPISHVCWSTDIIYDEVMGTNSAGDDITRGDNKIEDFPVGGTIVLTGECSDTNNYVEIGFKDAQGCGFGASPGDDGAVQITFGDGIECRWDTEADICNGGNDDQCIYKIYYESDRCVSSDGVGGAMINEEQNSNKNVFGMVNASEGTIISIWSVIIIGGLIIVFGLIGLTFWYCKAKNNSQKVEKQMQVINDVDTPVTVTQTNTPTIVELESINNE